MRAIAAGAAARKKCTAISRRNPVVRRAWQVRACSGDESVEITSPLVRQPSSNKTDDQQEHGTG
jgi:hypothetical protein